MHFACVKLLQIKRSPNGFQLPLFGGPDPKFIPIPLTPSRWISS